MSGRPALLLIGHGSRSAAGVAQFWQLSALLAEAAPHLETASGLIEFARPGIDEALGELLATSPGAAAAGVVAVPLVLLGAGHMKDDGPAALERARARFPSVPFSYARDLGVHPSILAAVEGRCREAVAALSPGSGREPARHAIVLVGRGSSDPDANADLYKAARLLSDRRRIAGEGDLDMVEPAFVSLAGPSVPEALERARLLGAERISVVPYFLFTGLLVERIGAQARGWARAHSSVEVSLGREIGPDRRVVDLVLERYEEAAAGEARMNCDGCAYRVALPGYEERVGRPPALTPPGSTASPSSASTSSECSPRKGGASR